MEARFVSEDSRTHHYLSRQTSPLLKQIMGKHLLTPHLTTGLDVMIDADKIEDLARLYRLYKMVPKRLPCLTRSLKESIARRGKEINDPSLGAESFDVNVGGEGGTGLRSQDKGKATAQPPSAGALPAIKWAQDVLDLKDKFDSLWKRAFDNDREIKSSLSKVSYLAYVTLET